MLKKDGYEYLDEDELKLKRKQLKSQVKEINKQVMAMDTHLRVTCTCGKSVHVHGAYKCSYCGLWFCRKCAEEHFVEHDLADLLYVVGALESGTIPSFVWPTYKRIMDKGFRMAELKKHFYREK